MGEGRSSTLSAEASTNISTEHKKSGDKKSIKILILKMEYRAGPKSTGNKIRRTDQVKSVYMSTIMGHTKIDRHTINAI